MRKRARWLGRGLGVGMLILPWLLIVTLACFWVRSHYYADNYRVTFSRVSAGTTHVGIVSAMFSRGDLSLTWDRGSTDVPDAATSTREFFQHRAFRDGMPMWDNMAHSGAERLGFYWIDRPSDFIWGFMAISARYTSARIPLWLPMLMLAGISGLQILTRRWWRRRWLRTRGSFPVIPSEPVTPTGK